MSLGTEQTSPSRRYESLVAGLMVVLLCATYVSFSWYGFDLLEEGYFATHARRVQQGGLPYRDFSTPYTPGVFYLYARMLDWFGMDIVPLRWLQVAGRATFGLALYLTARQLMPPFFAAIAPALILAVDTVPHLWGLHPGWYSTSASVLAVLAIARYLRTGRGRWLFAAGLASGVGFAFKQNLAAFGLIAALWLLIVAERHLPLLAAPWGGPSRRPMRDRRDDDTPAMEPSEAHEGVATVVPRWSRERAPGTGRWGFGTVADAIPLSRTPVVATAVRRVIQAITLLLLPLTATLLVRPYLSVPLFTLLVLPLAATCAVTASCLTFRSQVAVADEPKGRAVLSREARFYARPLLVLAGFGTITVPWLALLIWALEGRIALLGGFIGRVDPTGYFSAMPPLRGADLLLAGVTLLPPALLTLGRGGSWYRRGTMLALGVAGVLLAAYTLSLRGGPEHPWGAAGPAWSPYAGTGGDGGSVLFLYLPTLAFWAALARLLLTIGKGRRTTNGVDLLRLWYLVAGSALLLNQYPRMDFGHMLWSGGLLLVAGADVLHAWYRAIVRRGPALRPRTTVALAVRLCLVLLPAVAMLPDVADRLDGAPTFLSTRGRAVATAAVASTGQFVPLTPGGAGTAVSAPAEQARPIGEVVEFLRQRAAPGEPIFAYPAIPGFYYLADRPNATRFNHLFAGMASPEEQREMVRQLEAVRFVVWDDHGAHHWVQPGDNAPVTEYIRTHFRVEQVIGLYTILVREGRGPELPYFLPASR